MLTSMTQLYSLGFFRPWLFRKPTSPLHLWWWCWGVFISTGDCMENVSQWNSVNLGLIWQVPRCFSVPSLAPLL